jgi:hypothetical protein
VSPDRLGERAVDGSPCGYHGAHPPRFGEVEGITRTVVGRP